MKRYSLLASTAAMLVSCVGSNISAQSSVPKAVQLRTGWTLQSSALAKESGEQISTAGLEVQDWHSTTVPSTVLNALTNDGTYPDLRKGLNSYQIPDASDEFNKKHDLAKFSHLPGKRNPWIDPYWYRNEFSLGKEHEGRRVWLNFDGINYRADVWLNGTQIGDAKDVVGVYSRYRFDITNLVKTGGKNCVAVRTHLVDHPAVPETQLKVLGPRREFQHSEIMKDVSLPMTIGYDCSPTIPDRHTGLWQPVFLDFTGDVDLKHSFVKSTLPLPNTDSAQLTLSTELNNVSDKPVEGTLVWKIQETGEEGRLPVKISAGDSQEIVLTGGKHSSLKISNPKLWWPRGYGDQPLYRANLRFEIDGKVSDAEEVTFGIRQIDKYLHERNGEHGLRVLVNGRRIFCRGGYLQPEVLYNWDAARMEQEIRYLAEANLNVAFIFELPFPPEELLEICDRYGILFGHCFYNGHWMMPDTNFPLDVDLVARGTEDVVKRIRNHPSLFLYMAANENSIREDVYTHWRKTIKELDGTRIFIPSGYFHDRRGNTPEWIKPDTPVGINDRQPKTYGWVEPSQYYRWVRESPNWMFMLESGSASPPGVDTLQRFIPNLFDADPKDKNFPLTPTWAHHGANEYYVPFFKAMHRKFGPPESVEDFCRKSQPLQADQHRAMFEAVNHRMWDITSGYSEWCLNSCFPTVQWQIFDWYHRPTPSYYYIKRACEPVHVQLCPLDNVVTVVNTTGKPLERMELFARVFDQDSKLCWQHQAPVDVAADSYRETFKVDVPKDISPVYFVHLQLVEEVGTVVSENFYWLSQERSSDLKWLNNIPTVDVESSMTLETAGTEHVATVQVSNKSNQIAFFVHAVITDGKGGSEVLPIIWSDNYTNLLPGETRELTARVPCTYKADHLSLEIGGWNIESDFDCQGLLLSASTVNPNEEFAIEAKITGTFIDGSTVTLHVNDKPIATQMIYARENTKGSRSIHFPLTLSTPGTHTIRIGKRSTTVTVQATTIPTEDS